MRKMDMIKDIKKEIRCWIARTGLIPEVETRTYEDCMYKYDFKDGRSLQISFK